MCSGFSELTSFCHLSICSAYITNIRTSGAGSFHIETLNKCLELGKSAGQCLDKVLLRVLREEEQKAGNRLIGQTVTFGFLR